MVDQRGAKLRELTFEELKLQASGPVGVTVESRPATIGVHVLSAADGAIRVVVQGFLKGRLFGSSVALDGFYKHPDGRVAAMPDEEFYEFD